MTSLHLASLLPLLIAALFTQRQIVADAAGRSSEISVCGASGGTVVPDRDGKFIRRLTGWGDRHYPITTISDSARYYFDQGLGFYYGYHFTEALASFKEASRFDPNSAMTYWGQALAMGPYYNTFYYTMPKEVPEVVAEMRRHSGRVSVKERVLIDVMSKRYSTDMSNADRETLNRSYAAALEAAANRFKDDHDITALYIDAVMLEHKWDFWDNNGSPKPWTNDLVRRSEAVLEHEQHPAVLHYYIHLVEASRTPSRALASAATLKDVNPGIGHMVHMATHMYQRNGLYELGVTVNEQANTVNNNTDSEVPSLRLGKDRSTHIFAVQSFCAMTAGMYKAGLPLYERARRRQVDLTPDLKKDTYAQYVYMMPVLAHARLGKWNEILATPMPESTWHFAVALDQFARGIAYVRNGDLAAAERCLNVIKHHADDSLLNVRLVPFNRPAQACRIAAALLEGEVLFAGGNAVSAFDAFRKAVALEDALVYREPHDWMIPSRQFLGHYLIETKQYKEAEAVFREDLVHNPGNGWALVGLQKTLVHQQRTAEAQRIGEAAAKAFASADVVVESSVF